MDRLERGTGRLSPGTAAQGLHRHWIFVVLLVLAAGLRGVVLAAYHPALIFPDSVRYLQYAHNFTSGGGARTRCGRAGTRS